jgi:hypothetical protein
VSHAGAYLVLPAIPSVTTASLHALAHGPLTCLATLAVTEGEGTPVAPEERRGPVRETLG